MIPAISLPQNAVQPLPGAQTLVPLLATVEPHDPQGAPEDTGPCCDGKIDVDAIDGKDDGAAGGSVAEADA